MAVHQVRKPAPVKSVEVTTNDGPGHLTRHRLSIDRTGRVRLSVNYDANETTVDFSESDIKAFFDYGLSMMSDAHPC